VGILRVIWSMKTMFSLTFIAIIFSTILLLSGCQKKTAATNPNSQSKNELHENTKPLQAADLVGYDGTKLRKSVDKIKEANDKHNQEMENMAETGQDQ
jgi:outer membrane murein-binding lipoprotein Lpp